MGTTEPIYRRAKITAAASFPLIWREALRERGAFVRFHAPPIEGRDRIPLIAFFIFGSSWIGRRPHHSFSRHHEGSPADGRWLVVNGSADGISLMVGDDGVRGDHSVARVRVNL